MKPLEYPTTVSGMFDMLKTKLGRMVPEAELLVKAELAVEINELKKKKKRRNSGSQLYGAGSFCQYSRLCW